MRSMKMMLAVGVVLVIAVVAVVLVAGGGDEGEDAREKVAGGQPRYGGSLVVSLPQDPGMLNPAITTSGIAHPVTGSIFNGLVRLDRDFAPQPDLARSWQVSDDGRTYTFALARDVRWHDGKPFSSADVKFTFERILLKLHPDTRRLAEVVERIETPDEQTVVFRLKTAYPPFLKYLDEASGAILPRHLYAQGDPLTNPANAKPVGTGPFKVRSIRQGDRIELVRNDDYFKQGLPYLDRVAFRVSPPPAAAQAFQAGEVNLLLFPTPPDVARLKATPGAVVSEEGREGFARVIRLIPNLKRKPFGDRRVRQAMAYAIDRPFIAKAAYAGTLKPATGPISQFFEPFYSDDVPKYARDPARARRLLDEAGLKPGRGGVRLRTSLIFDPGFARTAQLVKQQLADVGIALDLRVMDFNAWVKKLYIDKDFDIGYSQLTDPPDPDIGTRGVYACSSIVPAPFTNGASYCNRRVDALFARAATETDEEKRLALYEEVQQIIQRDQPQIFLVDGIGPTILKADFKGFADAGAMSPYGFAETTWWTKGRQAAAQ